MLDTSILLLGVAWGRDVISLLTAEGCSLVLPACVLHELERIAQGNAVRSRHAQIILARLSQAKFFKEMCAAENVDDAVLALSAKHGALATSDYALARRAHKNGVRVFILTRKGIKAYKADRKSVV